MPAFTADAISFVANLWTACAAIVGVVAAGMGLETWRKQIRGQSEYVLAEKLPTETSKAVTYG